jgi:SHO1 osmosensor
MLCCILGVTFVFATNSSGTYSMAVCRTCPPGWSDADHLQVVGYLAAGLVMTTSAVNSLVYQPQGAMEAAAAGHILLSMVAVSALTRPLDSKH